jgi:hypothetical protein
MVAVSNPLDLSRNEILWNFIKLNNDQPLEMASYMQEGRVVPTVLPAITYEFTYHALLVLVVYHRCLFKEIQYYQLSFK